MGSQCTPMTLEAEPERPACALHPTSKHVQAILMLGGHDSREWTTTMQLFYPALSEVHDFDSVPFTQGYGGCILLGHSVYVIGGGDGHRWNRSAYSYDLNSRAWFQVSLPPRLDCNIESKGSALALHAMSSVGMRLKETLTVRANLPGSWKSSRAPLAALTDCAMDYFMLCIHDMQVADMAQERGSLGVAEVGGLIYAMGGGTGGPNSVNLDTIEVFTPDLNAWQSGPSMHEQRFTTSGGAVNGALYVTGGFNGTAYLSTAECLDPRAGKWKLVTSQISLSGCMLHSGLLQQSKAALLDLLPCAPHQVGSSIGTFQGLDIEWQLGSCLTSTVAT